MRLIKAFLIASLFSLSCVGVAATRWVDSIVMFGDSLSDSGLIYGIFGKNIPGSPPYYYGRFSNGPVWIEYVAQDMKKELINYAAGGASTNSHFGTEQHFFNLSWQVALFVTNHLFDGSSTWRDRIYVLWSGPNDYWSETGDPGVAARKVVDTIIGNVEMLISYGGRYFFIPNLPDLSVSPYAQLPESNGAQFSKIVIAHNSYMAMRIEDLQKRRPDVLIIPFDVSKLMDVVQNGYPDFFTNFTESCYQGNWYGNGVVIGPTLTAQKQASSFEESTGFKSLNFVNQALVGQSIPLKIAVSATEQAKREQDMMLKMTGVLPSLHDVQYRCTGYFFWDDIHPTTKAHQFLGQFAVQVLQKAGF